MESRQRVIVQSLKAYGLSGQLFGKDTAKWPSTCHRSSNRLYLAFYRHQIGEKAKRSQRLIVRLNLATRTAKQLISSGLEIMLRLIQTKLVLQLPINLAQINSQKRFKSTTSEPWIRLALSTIRAARLLMQRLHYRVLMLGSPLSPYTCINTQAHVMRLSHSCPGLFQNVGQNWISWPEVRP